MKSPIPRRSRSHRGFALIVTLSLMILLTVIAVGLLTLSTISLRATSSESADHVARANARLALMMALGELQKTAGLDTRITADASIYGDNVQNPNVVGVWKAWSPGYSVGRANAYSQKDGQFVSWLTSTGQPADLTKLDWGKATGSGNMPDAVDLFTQQSDGFLLQASKVPVQTGKASAGAMAWSVVQEATRAKVNVAGPENSDRNLNDDLQVQARPNVSGSATFQQPTKGWNSRATKVISMSQAKLDPDLSKPGSSASATAERGDFTTQGFGLLTDNFFGGLKTDLNLGFEMSDADFKQTSWGAGKFKNPFRSANVPPLPLGYNASLTVDSTYQGQRTLFRPTNKAPGNVQTTMSFDPANTGFNFPAAAVPTFDTLRSFYLTPYYLYNTLDGPTVFERGMDHVAVKPLTASTLGANFWEPPALTPRGSTTQTSYRPVLDRVIFLLSVGVGPGVTAGTQEARLVFTPIITLWNPYNVALEIEGAVAYPWMDVPFTVDWKIGGQDYNGNAMSHMLGAQLTSFGHGRTVDPYFFASITPDGSGNAVSGKSIRFKPGEVLVFAPATKTNVDFKAGNGDRARTVFLKPVTDINQLSVKGGIAIPTKNAKSGNGFTRPVSATESIQVKVAINNGNGQNDYPFSIGLEDAERAKTTNPTSATHGQSICDVQTVAFAKSGSYQEMRSAPYTVADLTSGAPQVPFGVIETYHRSAADPTATRRSDLVYTINPRQPFINRYLVNNASFIAGPHYETVTRSVGSLSEAIATDDGGRTAFYGLSNNSKTGEKALSFFEVPQAPMLSLAAFQHADISMTSYAPAYQIGNSWASAYMAKNRAFETPQTASFSAPGGMTISRGLMPIYDYSYLANEFLFDSFYFSGAAPTLQPGVATGSSNVWKNRVASVSKSYTDVLKDFISDPVKNPLRNPRMRLHTGDASLADLRSDLIKPEGCIKLAAHLYVDGAFNINSTSQKAWAAFLSGMRDIDFAVEKGSPPPSGNTAFPRFRNPRGKDGNNWMGFRSLTDDQIQLLAKGIVAEVRSRGPFLTLGEFVNRRVVDGAPAVAAMGMKGAIQAAIDSVIPINKGTTDTCTPVNIVPYPPTGRNNISPANTGVAIPGYLTQADVLQSIAPVMSARSDTFTIRGYGEARNAAGKVLAVSRCEAVVQRTPEFVDSANTPYSLPAEQNTANTTFGRKFEIISFRYLASNEVVS